MNNTKITDSITRFQLKGSKGKFAGKSLRMGYDLVTPGRIAEDIVVKINKTKKQVVVLAKASPRPPYDLDGMVDQFGFNKTKADLEFTLDFDFDKYAVNENDLFVSCHNGITRVFAVVEDALSYMELTDKGWQLVIEDDIEDLLAPVLDLD